MERDEGQMGKCRLRAVDPGEASAASSPTAPTASGEESPGAEPLSLEPFRLAGERERRP